MAAELRGLREANGKRTYASIVNRAQTHHPSIPLSKSSVGEWLSGRAVPSPAGKLTALVKAMTDNAPDPALVRLHRAALLEKRSATGRRRTASRPEPAPAPPPSHIPRLDAVHYADSDRVYDLVLGRGSELAAPRLDWDSRRGPGHVKFRRMLVDELDKIALQAKRFTPELNLRQLTDGDLLIFDTQVRTRNGVSSGQKVKLTGDLNRDPHIYIQRRRVRIVMTLKPEMITTDTAFGYFGEGTTRLADICRIKYRVAGDELARMPETDKVQYLATPLVLGTVDVFNTHADLRASPLFETIDIEEDAMQTVGPWVYVSDGEASSSRENLRSPE
ncbi:hypothetical protein H7J93_16480 [Mycobacterium barrassiae]|uniref:hypothetical protein n=1 Tax=Mycobacterium barrassiae TaxID=319709 RepID=UPI002265C677|nr:hypothetical protein [Mycobacterium barrassiae]MCV7301217.1 hypothetical protein [Mycobacterium barrassiae]